MDAAAPAAGRPAGAVTWRVVLLLLCHLSNDAATLHSRALAPFMAQYFGPPLHRGSVRQLLAGQTSIHPVLQVVDVKQIGSAGGPGGANERFRLMLSDGEHYQQAMLATQLNELVKNNEVRKFSVVQVDECVRPPICARR